MRPRPKKTKQKGKKERETETERERERERGSATSRVFSLSRCCDPAYRTRRLGQGGVSFSCPV